MTSTTFVIGISLLIVTSILILTNVIFFHQTQIVDVEPTNDVPEILLDDHGTKNIQHAVNSFEPNINSDSSVNGYTSTAIMPTMPYTKFIPWKEQTNKPFPCIIDLDRDPGWQPLNGYITNQPSDDGLLFIKIEKAASTTIANIATRIAHALAHRVDANVTRPNDGLKVQKICKSRINHRWSKNTEQLSKRDKDKSFLWTFLKDPTKRMLSFYFFFIIDHYKKEYTEDNLIDWLKSEKKINPGGQLYEIADKYPEINVLNLTDEEIKSYIQKVIDNMNFIGLVERMNESLVLLQLMLDLQPSDVAIVKSSKMAGQYELFLGNKKAGCQRMGYKREILPGAQTFLESDEWKQLSKIEYMLYDAANRSIDHTIETVIGRDKFNKALLEFEDMQRKVTKYCSDKVVLQCTANGTKVDKEKISKCYTHDEMGCGYECLDEMYPLE
mmetsp:Transcript_5808/g.6499  ORF Transcript_5808/g.6499 Transcript_5808/m.6499 type:complete len:441 (+) Transcript_5808:36-1358(+)